MCVCVLKALHSVAYQMWNYILPYPPSTETPKFPWSTSDIHLTDEAGRDVLGKWNMCANSSSRHLECRLQLLVVMADRPLPIGGCRQCDLLLVFRWFLLGLCYCVLCLCVLYHLRMRRGHVFSRICVCLSVGHVSVRL